MSFSVCTSITEGGKSGGIMTHPSELEYYEKKANPSFNDPDVFLQSVNLTKLVHSVSGI